MELRIVTKKGILYVFDFPHTLYSCRCSVTIKIPCDSHSYQWFYFCLQNPYKPERGCPSLRNAASWSSSSQSCSSICSQGFSKHSPKGYQINLRGCETINGVGRKSNVLLCISYAMFGNGSFIKAIFIGEIHCC